MICLVNVTFPFTISIFLTYNMTGIVSSPIIISPEVFFLCDYTTQDTPSVHTHKFFSLE